MQIEADMKIMLATKSNIERKYYHFASFEVEQIVNDLKKLIKRNYAKKMNSLNNKTLKFKPTDIKTEIITFLEDILKKKNMLKFITPNKMDARANRFFEELEAANLGEECVDVENPTINLSDELSIEDTIFNNGDSENQLNTSTASNEA